MGGLGDNSKRWLELGLIQHLNKGQQFCREVSKKKKKKERERKQDLDFKGSQLEGNYIGKLMVNKDYLVRFV